MTNLEFITDLSLIVFTFSTIFHQNPRVDLFSDGTFLRLPPRSKTNFCLSIELLFNIFGILRSISIFDWVFAKRSAIIFISLMKFFFSTLYYSIKIDYIPWLNCFALLPITVLESVSVSLIKFSSNTSHKNLALVFTLQWNLP